MRPLLRSRLVSLVPVVLLAVVVPFVAGCSDGTDSDRSGPTVRATGPDEPTGSAEETASSEGREGTTESTEVPPSSDFPPAVAAICTPYSVMVSAIQDAAASSSDPDAVAAAIGPVMKEFAAQVPALDRPPGMSADIWRGVEALAEEIVALPDRPTDAEVEAVEDRLSPQEREAVKDAATWFRSNCA